jgi:anaerobic selenocysteine-containing dehydrogenase
MRPHGEVELASADARARKIATGDPVTVSSNGTSLSLRARIARDLPPGTVRMPRDTAAGLHEFVEVTR